MADVKIMDIFTECPRCGHTIVNGWSICPYCEKRLVKPRLYIRVYADNDPLTKAEKMYQITPPHELKEIAKHLIEYAESEDE